LTVSHDVPFRKPFASLRCGLRRNLINRCCEQPYVQTKFIAWPDMNDAG
jgi:hypothetical protein